MRAGFLNDTNFQGKFIIANRLTDKPKRCVQKVQDSINELIQKKDYNLYLTQDYGKNVINIYADYPFPLKPAQNIIILNPEKEKLSINAKSSRYIDAAKNAIEKYDKILLKNEQNEWEQNKKQNQIQELKGILGTIAIFPLYVIDILLDSIHPKLSEKFEKILEKII